MDEMKLELQKVLGVSGLTGASVLFQVAIIIAAFVWFYIRFVKNAPVEKTVRGILFFLALMLVVAEGFSFLRLRILSTLLKDLVWVMTLSLVVIFQPELRRLMTWLGGRLNILSQTQKKKATNEMIDSLSQCICYWQKNKVGVLIVFENQDDISSVSTGGVVLNAVISTELLMNIFYKNTPLHDGAVVIKQGRIEKAGVVLPLSREVELDWKYGTRHRAALGVSENTDALVLVVSEESGDVSLIADGKIQTLHTTHQIEEKLKVFFMPLMTKEKSGPKK